MGAGGGGGGGAFLGVSAAFFPIDEASEGGADAISSAGLFLGAGGGRTFAGIAFTGTLASVS